MNFPKEAWYMLPGGEWKKWVFSNAGQWQKLIEKAKVEKATIKYQAADKKMVEIEPHTWENERMAAIAGRVVARMPR